MTTLDISRDVSAPADVVWTIMTDLENAADTISAIQAIVILSEPQEFNVGTTWRETRTMFGKQATEEMTVTQVDPGISYVVEAESHGARSTTIMQVVAPGESSSRISTSFDAEPTGTMAKFMTATVGKLFQSATRKAFARDLDDIAAAAEAIA